MEIRTILTVLCVRTKIQNLRGYLIVARCCPLKKVDRKLTRFHDFAEFVTMFSLCGIFAQLLKKRSRAWKRFLEVAITAENPSASSQQSVDRYSRKESFSLDVSFSFSFLLYRRTVVVFVVIMANARGLGKVWRSTPRACISLGSLVYRLTKSFW